MTSGAHAHSNKITPVREFYRKTCERQAPRHFLHTTYTHNDYRRPFIPRFAIQGWYLCRSFKKKIPIGNPIPRVRCESQPDKMYQCIVSNNTKNNQLLAASAKTKTVRQMGENDQLQRQ